MRLPTSPRTPPRRFQRGSRGDSARRGLATLPEGENGQEDAAGGSAGANAASSSSYQRVYPDRKPSLTVNTDIVSTMEAIEGPKVIASSV